MPPDDPATTGEPPDVDELKAQLRAVTAERDAPRLPAAATTWWPCAGLKPPFTPGAVSGNNDGVVRDADGNAVANCGGHEARADVIASLLNYAAAALAPAAPPGDAGTP